MDAPELTEMTYFGMVTDLLGGLMVSVEIFAFTLLIALPLGFPIALGRMSKNPVVSGFFSVYISVVRGTPLMLQIIFVYFAPYILFGLPLSNYPRLLATVFAFGLNYAAYFAEIYRSGIESIPAGQYEAAEVLGYGKAQTFFKIILPQVVKIILPSVTNEVITLVKDTSLCYAIGLVEMFTRAKQIATSTSTLTSFVVAGVMYYIFNFVVAWIMERCEKRLSYFH